MKERESKNSFKDIETLLVDIFKEILGIAELSIEDDFFRIGGNSIKAIQLLNRLIIDTGYDFTLIDIYEFNSVKKLSRIISDKSESNSKGENWEI